jgi:hypothetical protein
MLACAEKLHRLRTAADQSVEHARMQALFHSYVGGHRFQHFVVVLNRSD